MGVNCNWVIDWSAVAAIIAAGAAWLAAFLTYRTAKGAWKASIDVEVLKIREKWLASLREIMSQFIAEGMRQNLGEPASREFLALYSQILLSMSPESGSKSTSDSKTLASPYMVHFSEIEKQMRTIGLNISNQKSISAELGSLQVMFHKYLKLHWDRLQDETVNRYAKNK